jgi:hypothetical protein
MRLQRANPAQHLHTFALSSAEWGKSLSVAEYTEREIALLKTTFASTRITPWILVADDAEEGTLEIYSSCETFKMDCIIGGLGGEERQEGRPVSMVSLKSRMLALVANSRASLNSTLLFHSKHRGVGRLVL